MIPEAKKITGFKKDIISWLFLALFSLSSIAQVTEIPESISALAEELAADDSDPGKAELYIELLNELSENPVRINSSDVDDLSRLFFLSDFQIKALADYKRSSGAVVSIYELATIPGFDRQAAEMIQPYIDLSPESNIPAGSVRLRNSLISSFMVKPGENDTSFTGTPCRSLSKYKFAWGRFTGGLTVEKDAGERFFSGSPPLPDFFSGYLCYTGKGFVRKIIAGDFSSRFGQGLNINTGISTGLSLTAPGYMSSRNDIAPYTSSDENNFFRGIGAHLAYKKAGLILFLSDNNIDAATVVNSDSGKAYAENLYKTGLHNTPSSLAKKDAINEISFGISFNLSLGNLKAGLSLSGNHFSLPVIPAESDPASLYNFRGTENYNGSLYYSSLLGRIMLYGELAANDFHNYAMNQGALLRLSDRLTINFLYRNYSPGYTSFHSNGRGTNQGNKNEEGMTGNFTFEAARHLFLSAGYDLCTYPWLRYRCSFPSISKRAEIKLKYLPRENMTFDLCYSLRYTLHNDDSSTGIAGTEEERIRTFRLQGKYGINESLSLVTRIDHRIIGSACSRGTLLLQDIIYRFPRFPVTLWFRYCIFNTDDWNSRLYAYENDLLHSFSIPSFSGKGNRSYIMAKWEIGDRAEARIKYSITSVTKTGNLIEDTDEIKLQVRIWF